MLSPRSLLRAQKKNRWGVGGKREEWGGGERWGMGRVVGGGGGGGDRSERNGKGIPISSRVGGGRIWLESLDIRVGVGVFLG